MRSLLSFEKEVEKVDIPLLSFLCINVCIQLVFVRNGMFMYPSSRLTWGGGGGVEREKKEENEFEFKKRD